MSHTGATRTVALIAAVQFVYILDFLLLFPLGPDIALAQGFAVDRLGWPAAAYTFASAVSGWACLRWIDRHDRKPVLLLSITLFGLATLATGLTSSLTGLLATRLLAGLAGGPMVAVGLAIVIDLTTPAARGRAIANVMLGFSAAAVLGVPLSLELARRGDWATPFLVLAGGVAVLAVAVAWALPAMTGHARAASGPVSLRGLLGSPAVRAACLLQGLSQFSAFLIIPSFSAFFLLNQKLDRAQLGLLYLIGGVAAMAALQGTGRLTDRRGPLPGVILACAAMAVGLLPFFGLTALPVVATFAAFMAGNAARNVALAAATSQVPAPHQRAAFMALMSGTQDIAITAASLVAAGVLTVDPEGRLVGMGTLGVLALACAVILVWRLARWRPADTVQPGLVGQPE